MTKSRLHHRHTVLGVVARDPAFAAVAGRQQALLDDAALHRRPVADPDRRSRRGPRPSFRARSREATT